MRDRILPVALALVIPLTSVSAADLVPLGASWRFFAGLQEASPSNPAAWRLPDFDDSAWPELAAPFWYGDPQTVPGTELGDMNGNYSSVFLRATFAISSPAILERLELGAQSDDGCIAWLNGNEIARFNMPLGEIPYNGSSLGALSEPVPFQTFSIPNPEVMVQAGVNILAVQAFNSSPGSNSDFVIDVSLAADADLLQPTVANIVPRTSSVVASLTQIEIVFTEPVTGVDATDLLLNNVPATNVVALTAANYLFEFPEPATGSVQATWAPNHGIADLANIPNPFEGGSWSYTLDPDFLTSSLHITEFMAANDHTLEDSFGDNSDWIEVFNDSDQTVNLQGWKLTDSAVDLGKWAFPDISLPSGGYLLVIASGRNLTNPAAELHTNFRLGRESGFLALVSPDNQIASAFAPAYPPQETDVSFGRDLTDPQILGYFLEPTAGSANAVAGPGFSSAVRFSANSGAFAEPFSLTMTPDDPTPDLQIRYTLDGSPVHEGSTLYTAPIPISTTTRVRARSYRPGLWPGAPRTEFYIALTPETVNFTSDLPILVLHNEGGGEVPAFWDQPVLVQAFEPIDGVTSLTNRPGLSSQAVFHLRGSSTLFYPKGSFFLETQDELGFDQAVSFLGLPSESDWVLYAPNNFEPVMIHNPVAFELSRQMGQYASRFRLVVVFLNTTGGPIHPTHYNGIYVLEEKIKVDQDRVGIDKLGPRDLQAPEVTGGYLLSVDRSAPGEWPIYAGDQFLNVLDPPFWEFMSPERESQYVYLQSYFDSFFNALNGPDWLDPVSGYAAYIDVPAAIDHQLHGVVTFNVDALRLSGYLYKRRNGKIIMGPVWDFDRTQGSTDGRDFNPRLWRSRVGDRGTDMFSAGDTYHNPWYSRMFYDIDFWQRWVDRYQDLRDSVLSTSNVHAIIETAASQVRVEQPREILRWGLRPRSGQVTVDGYSHTFSGTYDGEVQWMKKWYQDRLGFIDGNLLARPQLNLPAGPVLEGALLTLSNSEPGTIYFTLDGSDPRLPGGEVAGAAQVYSEPIVLATNSRVLARVHNLQHRNQTGPGAPPLSTPWSGLSAATYVVETPPLVISEIMYHPRANAGVSGYVDNDYEFIELLNRGHQTLALAGFHFTNGIEFAFSATNLVTQLAPGERVVLVRNLDAFKTRYPLVDHIGGVYSGSLDNSGERIELVGPLLEPVLDLRYNNFWYRTTDGLGFSLVLRNESAPFTNRNDALNWRVSNQPDGSPGAPEPPPSDIPGVLITEALTHTDPPNQDSVELHNPGATPANIGGWWITDDLEIPFKFQLPATTTIASGGFLVFNESQFTNSLATSFRLSSLGDFVYLLSTDGGTNLTGYSHGFEYGPAFNGVSFGRHVVSTGADQFVAQQTVTLGAANPGPKIGPVILSEIMMDPTPASGPANAALDEYVELHNPTAETIALYDPLAPTNTWRLRGGIEFNFPTNVLLSPNSFLLVVSFSPELDIAKALAFRSHYSLSSETLLFGPYNGRLADEGDRVRLLRPDQPQGPTSPEPGLVPFVLVEEVEYSVIPPWPPAPTNLSQSLQRRDPTAFADDPVHWESAAPTPGTVNPSTGTLDSDADSLPNLWEVAYLLDPQNPDDEHGASGDPDQDALTNQQELGAGTHPRLADTDNDGLSDGWEVRYGLNPINRTGIHAGSGDPDDDGLLNLAEQTHGTDPLNPDSDSDQLSDDWEIAAGLDPNDASGDNGALGDPDQDGLTNLNELMAGTDPTDASSSLRLDLELLEDDRVHIRFLTAAGRAYAIQSRAAWNDQPWVTVMDIPVQAQSSQVQLITSTQNPRARYYRVLVKP